MNAVMIMKLVMGGAGILFLFLAFREYVRKKLTEAAGLIWALFGVLLLVLALWPGALAWCAAISLAGLTFLSGIFLFLALFLFWQSQAVSKLIRKNQELAMQVSLLNQENEQILTELNMIPARYQDTSDNPHSGFGAETDRKGNEDGTEESRNTGDSESEKSKEA